VEDECDSSDSGDLFSDGKTGCLTISSCRCGDDSDWGEVNQVIGTIRTAVASGRKLLSAIMRICGTFGCRGLRMCRIGNEGSRWNAGVLFGRNKIYKYL
jgi:hypothetical protein